MPWIWSDQLADLPELRISQTLKDTWTRRPVAVWQGESASPGDVASALAAEDDEPPLALAA